MALDDTFEEGGFVDFGADDFNETPDLTVIPDNTEAVVRLTALSMQVGKDSGKPYLLAILEIKGEADAREIRHMMMWPRDDMDAKQTSNARRKIKYFNQAFGIPGTGRVDFSSFLGREASAVLGVDADTGYGESNRIKRWIAGA